MKKIVMAFACAALVMGSMASCKKSNASLINEYEKVAKELTTAVKEGDMEKASKLSIECQKVTEELKKADLTPEEKQEMLQITAELATEVLGR